MVARAGGEGGNEELLFNGDRVSVSQDDKELWRQIMVIVVQQCDCT